MEDINLCLSILNIIVTMFATGVSLYWALLTLKVSKSTDENAKQTFEINKRLEEMEKRNDGPAVIMEGVSRTEGTNQLYPEYDGFRTYLKNISSGPAINLSAKVVGIKGNHFHLRGQRFINIEGNKYYPDVEAFISQYGASRSPNDLPFQFLKKDFFELEELKSRKDKDGIIDFKCELNYQSISGTKFKTTIEMKYSGSYIEILRQNINTN